MDTTLRPEFKRSIRHGYCMPSPFRLAALVHVWAYYSLNCQDNGRIKKQVF